MKKYDYIFNTDNVKSDLKRRSLKSGALTMGSQIIQFFLQLGSTMILARILSPEDYGINAMAYSLTGFAALFSNLGLSTATIQRSEINHKQVTNLFWINVAIGALITFIIAVFSPLVAKFYKTPEMLEVTLALSVIFFIGGLAVQHLALLNRQMDFYSITKIRVISLFSGFVVAIIAGYLSFGYWALVFNSITNVTVNTVACWIYCKWRPGKPNFKTEVRSMVKFGIDLVSFDVINYFSRNLDNILLGRYCGSSILGLYSKAYQLLMLPITNLRDPMARVVLPALSSLQNNPEQFTNYYLKYIGLLAFISMPLVAFMFVCSEQLIIFLLGNQWIGSSDLFKILAIAAFIQPVSSTTGILLVSLGNSKLYLKLGVLNAVVISLSFILGLPWEAKGIAVGYTLANYVLLFPNFFFAFKNSPVSIRNFYTKLKKPAMISIIMAGNCYWMVQTITVTPFISLCIFFIFSVSFYLSTFAIFSEGRKELKEYWSYLIQLRKKV
ncbi:MAG: lipopolysaccharide biosynthesis protein [Desulfobacter sp.]|nr:MAG: lipopolysaccharide biosynthesis protein [Desulfobacter sp.]